MELRDTSQRCANEPKHTAMACDANFCRFSSKGMLSHATFSTIWYDGIPFSLTDTFTTPVGESTVAM